MLFYHLKLTFAIISSSKYFFHLVHLLMAKRPKHVCMLRVRLEYEVGPTTCDNCSLAS